MRNRKYPWKYLNGEKLFKYYWEEMGNGRSCILLAKWCASQGMKNPKTGKIPTPMAVWFAMWRWAILKVNQEVAYKIYNSAHRDMGKFVSPEDWKKELKQKASVCLNQKNYQKWINESVYG